jgi:hypothetical protein
MSSMSMSVLPEPSASSLLSESRSSSNSKPMPSSPWSPYVSVSLIFAFSGSSP